MEHRAGISPIQRGHEQSFGTTYGSDASLMGQSFRGRGPKGFQRSDERVRELVSERLEDHDAIDASDIEVTVNSGEVTLSGTVDDRRTKRLAEDVAESVAGVKDVHNNLKVDRNFFSRMADTIRDAVEGPKDSR
jgi:osmotically-inducible protein OsmY